MSRKIWLTRAQSLLPEGRSSRVLLASVGVGILVGAVVSLFEWLTITVAFDGLLRTPLAVQVAAPAFGLAIAALILRTIGGGISPSTSDEYLMAYHSRNPSLPMRSLGARLLAGISTIGLGGALGLEGPSIYAGSTIGLAVQRRLDRFLGRDALKMLITAGAAAGVAAVFQAPATGVLFALEAPYRDDLAHRALLPSLLASAAGYSTFVSMPFARPEPLLGQVIAPGIGAGDLIAAFAIGVGAGLGGRLFASLTRWVKRVSRSAPAPALIGGGGLLLAGLALLSNTIFDAPLTLGPGVGAVEWMSAERTLPLIAALFVLRAIATLVTIGARGTGGLFIPLATQGVLLGGLVGAGLQELGIAPESVRLLPILGLAAFVAAGYRTPIAAVIFVAETTSNSGQAVVPALVAAAVSQLVAGKGSVSSGQRIERTGHLEERFTLPVASALTTDVLTVPPDATISEFVWIHALGRRQTTVPVVDGNTYVGMCSVADCASIPRGDWEATLVGDIVKSDSPTATPSWTLRDVVAAMEDTRTDVLAVTDLDRSFIGLVWESEIVKLGEILDETAENAG